MVLLLFLAAFLSATGTFVQNNCSQQSCSMVCGLTSPYDRCLQLCNGSACDSIVCANLARNCSQKCPGGICPSLTCGARICDQTCGGGDCGIMKCNAENTTVCEQSFGKEMMCDSESCTQNCRGGKCNMTCLANVKNCFQDCTGGECFYQCDALNCYLDCKRGTCTNVKSMNNKPTAPKSTGAPLQASLVLSLMFALIAFL